MLPRRTSFRFGVEVLTGLVLIVGGRSVWAEGSPHHLQTSPGFGPLAVVAFVDGTPIHRREIKALVDHKIPRSSYHRNVSEEKRDEFRREALDNLVIEILAAREGERRKLDVRQEVDRRIETVRKQLHSKHDKKIDLDAALRQAGQTMADFRGLLRRQFLAEAVRKADMTMKLEVTDDEVKQYFQEFQSRYVRPEAIRIKHMLIKVNPSASAKERDVSKKRAEQALAKLKRGAKFEKVAKRYTGAVPKGLEAGASLIHRGGLIRQIEDAVFSLKPGELSPVLQSIYGYHLIQVLEKVEPRQMAFDEVRDAVRKRLEKEERERLSRAWEARLTRDAKIEVRWPRLLPPDMDGPTSSKVESDEDAATTP